MSLLSGLRLALGTLTIIPVGNIHPLPPRAAGVAMLSAPVVVIPLAALAGVVMWLGSWVGLPAIVLAALVLAVLAIGTRAMHLDGLADTVDGFGGGWTSERALEIMRRGDVGPMGVAALVLTLLVQAGSIAALASSPRVGFVVAMAIVASRFAATVVCVRPVPAARGSGMGAVVAGSVPIGGAVLAGLLVSAAMAAVLVLSGFGWWWGPVAMGAATLVLVVYLGVAVRKFGGVTGDVIGAGIELMLTVLLIVLTLTLN